MSFNRMETIRLHTCATAKTNDINTTPPPRTTFHKKQYTNVGRCPNRVAICSPRTQRSQRGIVDHAEPVLKLESYYELNEHEHSLRSIIVHSV
eukprot:6454953-Amphidinium_carterae.2